MAEQRVEPSSVVDLIEEYVSKELADAKHYENSEPLDESGVYSLHRLGAEIYAAGWNDGEQSALRREYATRQREKEKRSND
jgi:hypothetical protein